MEATLTLEPARHAWRATHRSDLEPAFRRAQRHSRRVRRLRRAIPACIGIVISGYAVFTWLNPFEGLSGLPNIAKMVISGTRITMDLPRLAGYTRDGRSYELTAAAAAQDLKKPQLIELQQVRAKVELKDGNLVNITSDTGIYDTKTEVISLRQNVLVLTTNGNEVRLSEAVMDMRKGHVLSRQPAEVRLQDMRIDAQQMEVVDAGNVMHFRGGVKVEIRAEAAAGMNSRSEPSQ